MTMAQAFKVFKLKYEVRVRMANYKQRNWDKVKESSKLYMREWRKRPHAKRIVAQANAAYKQRNALAMSMYNTLVFLARKDGAFTPGPAQHIRKPWRIKR